MKCKIISIFVIFLFIACFYGTAANIQYNSLEKENTTILTIDADSSITNLALSKDMDTMTQSYKKTECEILKENNRKIINGDLEIIKSNQIIDQIVLSDYHVKGDVYIELNNCQTLNYANLIVVTNLWIEGDITIDWYGPQAIRIHIFNNPIVYGNISVLIRDVHSEDPDGVELLIYNNGENCQDINKNQAVGNIQANILDNWCMPMTVGINNNWVHSNITIEMRGNQVNTCTIGLYENHAGEYCDLIFEQNDVDRVLDVDVRKNNLGDSLYISVSDNPHFGWIEYKCPCVVYIYVIDNHCVKKDAMNIILMSGNVHYGMPFYNTIEDNGFGGQVVMQITGNICLMTGDMQNNFHRNKCDMILTILVAGNEYVVKDYASDNTASDLAPSITLQNAVLNNNNIQQNPQTVGSDSDGDGLTDDYEQMIGTDKNDKDTDNDGLYDGWDDFRKNSQWEKGEQMGEIGDPLQELDTDRNYGAISTLYNKDSEHPNPINKDIFVEVDFLKGCVVSEDTLNKVVDIFSKHCIRLHIDMGWPVGPAGGATGGDVITAGWQNDGKTYLYFDTAGNRRIFFPLKFWSNDFYDLKLGKTDLRPGKYFNGGRMGDREDIFHYVVFTNYYARDDSPIEYRPGAYGVGEFGRGSNLGDDFLVCYDNHIKDGSLDVAELQDTFMHELGHNLELDHSWEPDPEPNGSDPDPSVNPRAGNETVHDTVMYWSGGQKLDYLRDEWARINLAAVQDGSHLWYS